MFHTDTDDRDTDDRDTDDLDRDDRDLHTHKRKTEMTETCILTQDLDAD